MAKQIIILETDPQDGGRLSIRCVYWFAVPAQRRVPDASLTSQFQGIQPAELASLRDGSVLEDVRDISLPSSFTTTEIKVALQKDYTDRGAYLVAQPFRLQYAGVFFDGSVWSA